MRVGSIFEQTRLAAEILVLGPPRNSYEMELPVKTPGFSGLPIPKEYFRLPPLRFLSPDQS